MFQRKVEVVPSSGAVGASPEVSDVNDRCRSEGSLDPGTLDPGTLDPGTLDPRPGTLAFGLTLDPRPEDPDRGPWTWAVASSPQRQAAAPGRAESPLEGCGDFGSVRVVTGPTDGPTDVASLPAISIPDGLWGPDSFYDVDGDGRMDLLVGVADGSGPRLVSSVAVVSGAELVP